LGQGYAVTSVNVRLSTIKSYAKLAFKADVLTADDYALIRSVEGYSRKQQKRIDEQREGEGIDTRTGSKKPLAVGITPEQATRLKNQPDSPQGRRDALMMCLMLDHGLRVSEVAGLTVEDFDLESGAFMFYRPKVDLTQTHNMTEDTIQAAIAYLENDSPESGIIWRRSTKTGVLGDVLSEKSAPRSITKRVEYLGRSVELYGLSAHDCRHYWATQAARNGTPIERLKEAGGWSSLAMPARYIEAAKVANEGVKLY
jgi:integrase